MLAVLALALIALEMDLVTVPPPGATVPASGADTTTYVVGGSPLQGRPAPAFSLRDADGRLVSLADYRGRPVIVNFWASWCGPCKEEFPLFVAARQQDAAQGLEILGVVYKDTAASAAAFMASEGAAWPMLLDPQAAAATAYGVEVVPESFYLDPQGIVRTVSFGPPPASGLASLLDQILPRPSGSSAGPSPAAP